jgi:MinD superfamily P-loop ATPase
MLADCNVNVSDLRLVLNPRRISRNLLNGHVTAHVRADRCSACGLCQKLCRFDAIVRNGIGHGGAATRYRVDPVLCEGCGVCAWFCPEAAVDLEPGPGGAWFLSHTRYGPMVHATQQVAHRNPGRMVSLVRRQARAAAAAHGCELLIVDGPPGIGGPARASILGADLVLIVTEPTPGGAQDFARAAELTDHLDIAGAVCVNRWDLNPEATERIEAEAERRNIAVAGRVRHDHAVTQCQRMGATVVEYTGGAVSQDIRALWGRLAGWLG